jgi:ABC-type uncharacterized transport system permease subunit
MRTIAAHGVVACTIAAHVVIVCLALVAGFLGTASYGISCFYAEQPFGSSNCSFFEGTLAFLELGIPTAAILYAVWAMVFVVWHMLKNVWRMLKNTSR